MTAKRVWLDASGPHGGRQSPAWLVAVAAAIAISGLTTTTSACATALAPVRLPPRSAVMRAAASASVATSPPSGVITPRQQVLGVVAAYTTALGQAEESRSTVVAHDLLQPYLATDRIEGLVQAMAAIWARGVNFEGRDIRHVSSATVAGRRAFVHDCDDTSGMDLVDISTDRIVPGSAGRSDANVVTRLDLVAGHWLVQFQLLEDAPCAQ